MVAGNGIVQYPALAVQADITKAAQGADSTNDGLMDANKKTARQRTSAAPFFGNEV